MLCEYGCGNEAKHQTKEGKNMCLPHSNSCPEIRRKNSNGLKKAYDEGRREGWPITDEQRAWSRGKTVLSDQRVARRFLPEDIFSNDSSVSGVYIKSILIKEGIWEHICSRCNLTEWLGEELTLEVDHINGNNRDNRLENLRLLCPNCHSQTPTWRKKKTKKPYQKHTDQEIIDAIVTSRTMYEALCKLDLAWGSKGTFEKIILKYEINFKMPV